MGIIRLCSMHSIRSWRKSKQILALYKLHMHLVLLRTNSILLQGFALSSSEDSQQSIFTDFSPCDLQEPCNTATFSHSCSTFSSWLCQDGNCLFALATGTGMILLIKLPPPVTDGELR